MENSLIAVHKTQNLYTVNLGRCMTNIYARDIQTYKTYIHKIMHVNIMHTYMFIYVYIYIRIN